MCRSSDRPVVQYNGAAAEQVLKDIEIEVRRLIIEYQRRTADHRVSASHTHTAAVGDIRLPGAAVCRSAMR